MRIGVFDSGIGGITVLAELRRRFPGADYIYLGDTANVPYGTKSPRQIERLSIECAKILMKEKIDLLVVACNTASSWALPALRKTMGKVPVIGVVEPGAKAVVSALSDRDRKVVVFATRATVRSGAYDAAIARLRPSISVIEQECPLLVPMIEEGWVDHPVFHRTLREYVGAALKKPLKQGIALLGCTHYPWAQAAFERALPGWRVINSAEAIADAIEQSGLPMPKGRGRAIRWIFTDPHAVPAFARQLMKE